MLSITNVIEQSKTAIIDAIMFAVLSRTNIVRSIMGDNDSFLSRSLRASTKMTIVGEVDKTIQVGSGFLMAGQYLNLADQVAYDAIFIAVTSTVGLDEMILGLMPPIELPFISHVDIVMAVLKAVSEYIRLMLQAQIPLNPNIGLVTNPVLRLSGVM